MADDRTDRFRPVFEPEDIFDRFVKNANASSEVPLRREDEPTGQVPHARRAAPVERSEEPSGEAPVPSPPQRPTSRPPRARGGPPTWDHEVTVKAPYDEEEGTRPDAPMPIAMARAFGPDDVTVIAPAVDDRGGAASPLAPDDDDDDDDDQDLLTVPRASPLTTDSGQRIVLLTRVKPKSQPPIPLDEHEPTPAIGSARLRMPATSQEPTAPAMEAELLAARLASVPPRDRDAQRAEAAELVPDLEAAAARETTYVGEGVEDGQMPTRQLDQILSDMAVLLRYGHAAQVRERLDDLRRTYPEDLLLLRRLAEFHVQHQQTDDALETLFALAGGLFERKNVEGMRQVLEQVQTLDAHNPRALRLLGLLEQRE